MINCQNIVILSNNYEKTRTEILRTFLQKEKLCKIFMLQNLKKKMAFKEAVSQHFRPPFFYNSTLPGTLTKGVKYFRFWLRVI